MASAGRYTPTDEEPPAALHCCTATRELTRTWRVSSFSALAASGAPINRPAEEGLDHDAATEIPATERPAARPLDRPLVVLHDFPAGARAGQLIHDVFEHFDFRASEPDVLHAAVTAALGNFGFEVKWAEALRN